MPLADDLRAGLERGELFLEYQPIVSLLDRKCVGGEALARWRRGEIVLPGGEFVPQIEGTPLAGRITYWAVEQVARELGDWLDANPEAHVSINVPPEIIGRGGIEHAAVQSGLRTRYKQIVLEITERGVPDRMGLDALNAAAERGLLVALDDTMLSGTNLALLARSNLSMIKTDRSLTAQLAPGLPQPSWLIALRALLRASSLQVVAEGVETDYQARWLRAAGVQRAQGHYFSPPVSADGLKQIYARDHAR
jgi:sensor c-di-GMP phosphodiesterase-like protein